MNAKGLSLFLMVLNFVVLSIYGQETDYEVARRLYEKGDLEGAFLHYSKALKEDKKDYRIYMGRAQVLIHQEKYKEALKDYDAAIQLEPEDSRIYYNRGNCFLEINEEQAAFADFNKAINLDPANYRAYNSRGFMYFSKDSLEKAEEDYLRAISLSLNYRRAYFNLADLYVSRGQVDIALELIAEFIQHNQEDYKAFTYLGLLYLQVGNYELASKFLGTSLGMEISQPIAIEQLAEILVFYLQDYDAAIQFLAGIPEKEKTVKTNYLLGMSYFSKTNYDKALETFRMVRTNSKDTVYQEVDLLIVSCLDELGRKNEVIRVLDSLEKEGIMPAEVSMQQSLYYLGEEDYKASLKYLEQSIKERPDVKSFVQKAFLLSAMGKNKEALKLYDDLDTSQNYFVEIQQGKGSVLEQMGEKKRACGCYYSSVVAEDRENAAYLLRKCGNGLDSNQIKVLRILDLMQVYSKKGNAYSDLEDFDFLIQMEPEIFDFRLWRGIQLKSRKKYQEAIRDFSKCIALESNRFEGYYFAGNTQLEAGDTTSFLTTLTIGIHKTEAVELYYSRALFYMGIDDFEYAYKDLKDLLKIQPSYSNAYYQLGLLFVENDEKEKACKYFKQALLLGHSKARLEYKISCR